MELMCGENNRKVIFFSNIQEGEEDEKSESQRMKMILNLNLITFGIGEFMFVLDTM